jgi:phosphoribosylglycinamide formyltransferase-1
MIDAFPDRILNIHPSLLPAFPGLDAQRAALAQGVRITGCTVFIVRAGIDDGPIVIQAAVPVGADDDEVSLSERILRYEHIIYPYAIRLFQEGRIEVRGQTVIITDLPPVPSGIAIINPPAG